MHWNLKHLSRSPLLSLKVATWKVIWHFKISLKPKTKSNEPLLQKHTCNCCASSSYARCLKFPSTKHLTSFDAYSYSLSLSHFYVSYFLCLIIVPFFNCVFITKVRPGKKNRNQTEISEPELNRGPSNTEWFLYFYIRKNRTESEPNRKPNEYSNI